MSFFVSDSLKGKIDKKDVLSSLEGEEFSSRVNRNTSDIFFVAINFKDHNYYFPVEAIEFKKKSYSINLECANEELLPIFFHHDLINNLILCCSESIQLKTQSKNIISLNKNNIKNNISIEKIEKYFARNCYGITIIINVPSGELKNV